MKKLIQKIDIKKITTTHTIKISEKTLAKSELANEFLLGIGNVVLLV